MIEMDDVIWSDWGKEQRILETLQKVGKQPAFPLEVVAASKSEERHAAIQAPFGRLVRAI